MPLPASDVEFSMIDRPKLSLRGEPVWEVAWCFPRQGDWTESDYLEFEQSNRAVELVDGCLEFLPVPTRGHQRMIRWLLQQLEPVVRRRKLGEVLFAPCPIRLQPGLMREPDLFITRSSNTDPVDASEVLCVIEILSPGTLNRDRDLIQKRRDYALARIPEYWIVDPEHRTLTVLVLHHDQYESHGEYGNMSRASSPLLPDVQVQVTELFGASISGDF